MAQWKFVQLPPGTLEPCFSIHCSTRHGCMKQVEESARRLEMQDYLAKDALAEADKLGVLPKMSPIGDNTKYPTIAEDQTGLEKSNVVIPPPGLEGLKYERC